MMTNVSHLQTYGNILIRCWLFAKMTIFYPDALAAVQVLNLMY